MITIRRNFTNKIICLLVCLLIYYSLYKYDLFNLFQSEGERGAHGENLPPPRNYFAKETLTSFPSPVEPILVAVVACEKRLEETLNMIKSCLIYHTKLPLKFIVIADDVLIENFTISLKHWQKTLNQSFQFEMVPIQFPEKEATEWRKLFKPCASQRLFLPSLLPHVDSLLYLDTDTVFLSPVDMVWDHFKDFNSSHMAALVLEHEDPNVSWYSRFAKHPFYGKLGVNSGVMLMNLTRMRAFHWEHYVFSVHRQWKTQLSWGDQDIINIIFHYHSDKLLLMDCSYNYRPDQCMYGSACPEAIKTGAKIVHGSRGSFHSNKQPAFSAIYNTTISYQLGQDERNNYLEPLLYNLQHAPESNCGKIKNVFTMMPKIVFNEEKTL